MKKLKSLVAASVAMFVSFGAFAADEAKAVLSDSGKTMTFVYDSKLYGTKGTDWFSVAEAVAQAQTTGTRKPWYTAGAHETVTKVVFDRSFALYKPTNCYQWFRNFSKLTTVAGIVNLDVSEATNLGMMFAYCSSLTTVDLAQFDTAKVTSIYAMFNGCSKLTTIYASNKFVTTKLTTPTEQVFDSCTQLVGGNGTKFSSSYRTAERARVDVVDDPGYFTLKEPTVVWDSSKSILTFYFKPAKELPQGSQYTRYYPPTKVGNPPWISKVTPSKVVIDATFSAYRPKSCYAWFCMKTPTAIEGLANLDVSGISYSAGLYALFMNCENVTMLDLSNFDTTRLSSSANLDDMFRGCSSLKTIYVTEKFVVNPGSSGGMFKDCSPNLKGGNGTTWSADKATDKTYAKIDKAGQAGYFTAAPVAVWSSDGTTLTFYADGAEHEGKVTFSVAEAEAQAPDDYAPWFYAWEDVTKVVFDDSFKAHKPKHCGSWFDGFCEMTAIEGIENLDTSEATSLYALFNDCNKLTSLDLGTWDTAKVTDMTSMFADCSSLKTIIVSDKFSTAAVTVSDNMFSGCSTNLKGGNGTAWSSDKATDKTYAKIDKAGQAGYFSAKVALAVWYAKGNELLFYYDIPKKIPTYDGQFSVAEAEEMTPADDAPWASTCAASAVRVTFNNTFADYRPKQCVKWFAQFANLQYVVGLKNLNVSEATELTSMFYGCEKLRVLDLSNFDTAQVTTMNSMFAGCAALESVYVSPSFTTSALAGLGGNGMFTGCASIRGENDTAYDADHTSSAYAHIDAAGDKGYFSNPPVAVLSADGTTLTFYADGVTHDGTAYPVGAVLMNEPGIQVPWSDAGATVTEVKFDSSFRRCRPAHCCGWFSNFRKLTNVKTPKNLSLGNATDLGFLFQYCEDLETLNVFTWDTAKATSMKQMFNGCTSLKKIVASADGFSTAAVANSANMFNGCTALVGGYGTVYDSGKTDATYARGDTKAQKGYFSYPAVAYCNANALTFYCDGEDHGSGVGIEYYVNESEYDVEQDWSSQKGSVTSVAFDPSFVNYRPASCYGWFDGFAHVTAFTGLQYLDVSNCEYLSYLFRGCAQLTALDLTTFDTAQVQEFDEMFAGCSSLATITATDASFSLAAKESAADMFNGCSALVGANKTAYSGEHTDASYAHVDAVGNPGYFTGERAAVAVYDDATKTLTFYYDNLGHSGEGETVYSVSEASDSDPTSPVVPWSGKGSSVTKVVFDASFASFQPKHCAQWFYGFSHVTAFVGLENLDVSKATRLSSMFSGCSQVTTLDLSTWNTANVAFMPNMFRECTKLTNIYVSPDFTTAKVTSTGGKFGTFTGCTQLPNFNPSKTTADQAFVGDGGYLSEKSIPVEARAVLSTDGKTLTFYYDDSLHTEEGTAYSVAAAETIDPETEYAPWYAACHEAVEVVVFDSSFADYKPKSLGSWFYGFAALGEIANLKYLDTSAVTNMAYAFEKCTVLQSLDLLQMDTANVTSMKEMFGYCEYLTSLDLTSFDTAQVTDMSYMFGRCKRLRTIYVSQKFTTAALAGAQDVFAVNTALVGGCGTVFSDYHLGSDYARIDGGATDPGYFSETPKVGLYLVKDLQNGLGVVIPSDVDYAAGDKVTVKVEGLAKGLKLAQDKTTKAWILSGVPTEAIGEENPMYARVTVTYKDKTKGKAETLQRIYLDIAAAEVVAFPEAELKADYAASVKALWPEADATWGFKGWPAGLKYTAKDVLAKDKSVLYPAFTVYGKPTKAGVFTITATHPKQVGKTKYTETETATLTVWGDDGATDFAQTDTCGTGVSRALDAKSVSGLPTGLKFAKGYVTGTPTKAGVYAVTVTANDKSKTTSLWKVETGANDGVMDGIAWTEGEHALVETDANGVSLMQGASCNWPVTVPSGAKVTVSGLPTGLKFAQDKKTKEWSVAGVPTKVESKLVTFTTVANGSTVVERRAFEVRANAYAGTYCLVQEEAYEVASLSAVLTVAAGGTAKLIFTENARKWTVSAKSIIQGGVIGLGFTLPADKKAGLEERLLIVDLDGQKLWLGGTVKLGDLYQPIKLPKTWTEDVVITAYDKYDTDGAGTYGYLYLSATINKKTGVVGVSGKLSDGAAIKGTTYLLDFDDETGDALIAPVLVTDKQKQVLSLTIGDTSTNFVRRDGEAAAVKADLAYGEFNASELKNKKASDLSPYANVCAIYVNGSLAANFTPTAKQLATKLGTGGLIKLTQKDADGVTWTLEMVPCYNGTTFMGIATGKTGKTTYTGQAILFYQE